jgi:hypothetical protein
MPGPAATWAWPKHTWKELRSPKIDRQAVIWENLGPFL